MKKIIEFLSLALLLLGIISCSNPLTTNPKKDIPTITQEGNVKINVEQVPNAEYCTIYRTNITKQEPNRSYTIHLSNYTKNPNCEIIDYFVTPGDKYLYEIEYKAIDNRTIIKTDNSTFYINPTKGLGELCSTPKPAATFDETTGKLTFSQIPQFSQSLKDYFKENNLYNNFYMSYENPTSGAFIYFGEIKEEIDVTKLVQYPTFYGQPLTIKDLTAQVSFSNYSCSYKLPPKDIESMPQIITVLDTRPTITFDQDTSNGVRILLDNSIQNVAKIKITKHNIFRAGDTNYYPLLGGIEANIEDIKANSISDYFVEKDKEYYYVLEYKDKYNKTLLKTKECPITPSNGYGELSSTTNPTASYDERKGILTFSVMPEFAQSVHNAINKFTKQTSSNYFKIYYSDAYDVENTVLEQTIQANTDLTKGIKQEFYNKDLKFNGIVGYVKIDNITYHHYLNTPKNPIPSPIKVPNVKEINSTLKLENVENGVRIYIPSEIPRDARFDCEIRRMDIEANDKSYYVYLHIRDFSSINYVDDYFTKPGKKYLYKMVCQINAGTPQQWEWKTIYESDYTPITAANGNGEITIVNEPKSSYDGNKQTITYDPIPLLPSTINDFIETKILCTTQFNIQYNNKNTSKYFVHDLTKAKNTFDVGKELNKGESDTFYFTNSMTAYISTINDDISYIKEFYKQDLNKLNFNYVNEINIKGTK